MWIFKTYCTAKWVKAVLRIRIHIKLKGRIRIRINFQMTSQNVWNMSLFEHFLKVLTLYFWKLGSESGPASTSKIQGDKQDPDPDPHVTRIRNTGGQSNI